MDIGPGDYVECVNGRVSNSDTVVTGHIYRVDGFLRRKCRHCGDRHEDGFILSSDKDKTSAWCPKRFSPIYRPKADAFTHLLTDIPSDLEKV